MDRAGHRYTNVAILLHWLIAILVIGQILLVWIGDAVAAESARLYRDTHKAVGMSLLILTLARIGWRLGHRAPPLPAAMKRWEKLLAGATHVLFYAALLVLPLSGWLASSAVARDISWFGLFNWPLLPIGGGREASGMFMDVHRAMAKGLFALLALHVAAALKHQFFDRDNILGRMRPVFARRER